MKDLINTTSEIEVDKAVILKEKESIVNTIPSIMYAINKLSTNAICSIQRKRRMSASDNRIATLYRYYGMTATMIGDTASVESLPIIEKILVTMRIVSDDIVENLCKQYSDDTKDAKDDFDDISNDAILDTIKSLKSIREIADTYSMRIEDAFSMWYDEEGNLHCKTTISDKRRRESELSAMGINTGDDESFF